MTDLLFQIMLRHPHHTPNLQPRCQFPLKPQRRYVVAPNISRHEKEKEGWSRMQRPKSHICGVGDRKTCRMLSPIVSRAQILLEVVHRDYRRLTKKND